MLHFDPWYMSLEKKAGKKDNLRIKMFTRVFKTLILGPLKNLKNYWPSDRLIKKNCH